MSSTIDACSYRSNKENEKCPKSPDGKHHYIITCGDGPSCEKTCKYCKDFYYTK